MNENEIDIEVARLAASMTPEQAFAEIEARRARSKARSRARYLALKLVAARYQPDDGAKPVLTTVASRPRGRHLPTTVPSGASRRLA